MDKHQMQYVEGRKTGCTLPLLIFWRRQNHSDGKQIGGAAQVLGGEGRWLEMSMRQPLEEIEMFYSSTVVVVT